MSWRLDPYLTDVLTFENTCQREIQQLINEILIIKTSHLAAVVNVPSFPELKGRMKL